MLNPSSNAKASSSDSESTTGLWNESKKLLEDSRRAIGIAPHQVRPLAQQALEKLAAYRRRPDHDENAACAIEAECSLCFASADYDVSAFDAVHKHAGRAFELFDALGDSEGQTKALVNLARASSAQGNYPRSMELAERALALAVDRGDRSGEASARSSIGVTHLYVGRYREALQALESTLALEQELEDKRGIQSTLSNLGAVHARLGDYQAALEHYHRSLAILDESRDPLGSANLYGNLANTYHMLGNFGQALEHCMTCLRLQRQLENQSGAARALMGLGNIHSDLKEYQQSLSYFEQALAIQQAIGDREGESASYINMVQIFTVLGRSATALEHAERCLAVVRAIGNQRLQAFALLGIGNASAALGDRERAEASFRASAELFAASGEKSGRIGALLNLGEIFVAQERLSDAGEALTAAQQLAEETGEIKQLIQIHRQLAILHRQSGQWREVAAHQDCEQDYKERVFNEESDRRIKNLQIIYKIEQARQEAEISRLKNVELAAALAKVGELNEELQRTNRQLTEINREKNDFLGIAAHDLRDPLVNIKMLAELLHSKFDSLSKEQIQELANDTITVADKMFELIEQLLDVNRIEQGLASVNFASGELCECLRQSVTNFQHKARLKGIALQCQVPDAQVLVNTDTKLLRRILDNLLSNAIKFAPINSCVLAALKVEANAATLFVQDEGPGLTAEDHKRLFTKFARLSARPTGKEHSIGLGLAIVKKIASLVGAKVWCESEEGKGATFFVQLPLG